MVEQAIEQYMKNVGKLPLGIAFSGQTPDVGIPSHVMMAVVPALAPGTLAVMPLQSLLDLVTATIFVEDDDDDE